MHETVATMTCCGADATPNSYYNSVLDDRPPTRFLISVTRRVHDVFWTRSRTSEVIRELGSRRKTTLCARQHGAVQYVMFNSLLTVAISVLSWHKCPRRMRLYNDSAYCSSGPRKTPLCSVLWKPIESQPVRRKYLRDSSLGPTRPGGGKFIIALRIRCKILTSLHVIESRGWEKRVIIDEDVQQERGHQNSDSRRNNIRIVTLSAVFRVRCVK